MASDHRPIKVIYILGAGHSGSTLLDLMLGSHSSIESLGEIKNFSAYMGSGSRLSDDQKRCTCGVHVRECLYWQRMLQALEKTMGTSRISLEEKDPAHFGAYNAAVFQAALDMTGKHIICESSKNYSRLKRLLKSRRFDMLVVHLVRDSRAVAYSYVKRGQSPLKVAYNWQMVNLFERVRLGIVGDRAKYILVRYEDLVEASQAVLSQILERVGLSFEQGQLRYWEMPQHNLGGNSMRHRKPAGVEKDIQYLSDLTPGQWRLCTLVSALGLKAFGYALRRQSALKDNAEHLADSKP